MIQVDITWMENRSNRNAYYQIFQFAPDEGYSVPVMSATVTHFGSLTDVRVAEFHRPVTSGKSQVIPGRKLALKAGEKLKRGYNVTNRKKLQLQANDPWFTETFGAAMAFEIEAMIFPKSGGVVPPRAEPETLIVHGAGEVITDRPDSWGTW